jgi:hypothetical protein
MLDRGFEGPAQDPDLQSDTDVFTQPVARRPIHPQSGCADDDNGAIAAFKPDPDERTRSSTRPL